MRQHAHRPKGYLSYKAQIIRTVIQTFSFEEEFSFRDVMMRLSMTAHAHITKDYVQQCCMNFHNYGYLSKKSITNKPHSPVVYTRLKLLDTFEVDDTPKKTTEPYVQPPLSPIEKAWTEFRSGLTIEVPEIKLHLDN